MHSKIELGLLWQLVTRAKYKHHNLQMRWAFLIPRGTGMQRWDNSQHWPTSPLVSQLTSQLDQITSACWKLRQVNSNHISDGTSFALIGRPKHCFGRCHYVVLWFIDAVFRKLRSVRQQLVNIY